MQAKLPNHLPHSGRQIAIELAQLAHNLHASMPPNSHVVFCNEGYAFIEVDHCELPSQSPHAPQRTVHQSRLIFEENDASVDLTMHYTCDAAGHIIDNVRLTGRDAERKLLSKKLLQQTALRILTLDCPRLPISDEVQAQIEALENLHEVESEEAVRFHTWIARVWSHNQAYINQEGDEAAIFRRICTANYWLEALMVQPNADSSGVLPPLYGTITAEHHETRHKLCVDFLAANNKPILRFFAQDADSEVRNEIILPLPERHKFFTLFQSGFEVHLPQN